jgi:predicted LPLAT superfamily acyltransferase
VIVSPTAFCISASRREQVEVEILLDDADARARQGDRFGADLRGDVGKFLAGAAGGNIELARILHRARGRHCRW